MKLIKKLKKYRRTKKAELSQSHLGNIIANSDPSLPLTTLDEETSDTESPDNEKDDVAGDLRSRAMSLPSRYDMIGREDSSGRFNSFSGSSRRIASKSCMSLPESEEDLLHSATMRCDNRRALMFTSLSTSSLFTSTLSLSSSHQDSFRTSTAAMEVTKNTEDFKTLIKPFVSDLAFRSVVFRRSESSISFEPYSCQCAVLFVDLSGYSRITAAIAHRGAHALSSVVNAYLDKLLNIIDRWGGDVVKFAGDAVLVVWEGAVGDDDELEYNILCASKCALELQEKAGNYHVVGTELMFRIHIGICCGLMDSEIFAAPSHQNMQRLYHSISGHCLSDISELVDLAKAGETAISDEVLDYIEGRCTCEDIEDDLVGAKLLTGLELEDSLLEAMDVHIRSSKEERMGLRDSSGIEDQFIHANVINLLTNGGLAPTQIAQVRNLCVLFIAKTSSGSAVNWLMEVQGVLDWYRCPIIQIIHDDKGVHVVAAVNLYEAVPQSALLGLDACRELVKKQMGCAIGIAMGSTFCGVTGSSTIACRWDITGPPPVRAARLMQFALANEEMVAIDSSLLIDPMAASRMTMLAPSVKIKGSLKPCAVYKLSLSKFSSVFRVMETLHKPTQNKAVGQVRKFINTGRSSCAVILTGMPFSGHNLTCEKAAALSGFVPFKHVCDETAGLAQLARTIATWYSYVDNLQIQDLASSVLDHMDNRRWSIAHDKCVDLVHTALAAGLKACFIIDHIQVIDAFSLSILRSCLQGRHASMTRESKIFRQSSTDSSYSSDGSYRRNSSDRVKGKIVFLGIHTTLYHGKTAEKIKEDITRTNTEFRVRVVKVDESTMEELRAHVCEIADVDMEDRWLRCHAEASGYALQYFIERMYSIRDISSQNEEGEGIVREEITKKLKLHVPPGYVDKNQQYPVTQVSADITMKSLQIFDDLPPIFQVVTKVISIATRTAMFAVPKTVVWKVTHDLCGGLDASRFETILREMKEMDILKEEVDDKFEKIAFKSVSIGNVARDVCTPFQIETISIRLEYRLKALKFSNFKVPFVLADLSLQLGQDESIAENYWRTGYKLFVAESAKWSKSEKEWWIERISDLLENAGFEAEDVLGERFAESVPDVYESVVPLEIYQIKSYMPPISFGPLCPVLSVVSRNLFQEYGAHHRSDGMSNYDYQKEMRNALDRYLQQVSALENFMDKHGVSTSKELFDKEKDMINYFSSYSGSAEDIHEKTKKFLNEFLPNFVVPRFERLREMVGKAESSGQIPNIIKDSRDVAIGKALSKLQGDKNEGWKEETESALMVLAVMNWTPTPVAECPSLPYYYYPTICRIRDEVMKQSTTTNNEFACIKHQHSFEDFKAFLIVTAVLSGVVMVGRKSISEKSRSLNSIDMMDSVDEEEESSEVEKSGPLGLADANGSSSHSIPRNSIRHRQSSF